MHAQLNLISTIVTEICCYLPALLVFCKDIKCRRSHTHAHTRFMHQTIVHTKTHTQEA